MVALFAKSKALVILFLYLPTFCYGLPHYYSGSCINCKFAASLPSHYPFMKKRLFFIVAITLIAFTGARAQTPQQFDKQVGKIVDSLYNFLNEKPSQNMLALANETYAGYKDFDARMLAFAANSETLLRTMPDVRNSKPVRTALLNFLVFEHRLLMTELAVFDKLPTNATNPEISKALNELPNTMDTEDTYRLSIGNTRNAYAKENGFTPFTES